MASTNSNCEKNRVNSSRRPPDPGGGGGGPSPIFEDGLRIRRVNGSTNLTRNRNDTPTTTASQRIRGSVTSTSSSSSSPSSTSPTTIHASPPSLRNSKDLDRSISSNVIISPNKTREQMPTCSTTPSSNHNQSTTNSSMNSSSTPTETSNVTVMPTSTQDDDGGYNLSPEVVFLVKEHAKALSTLSTISRRLEKLEATVCDIQKAISVNSCNGTCCGTMMACPVMPVVVDGQGTSNPVGAIVNPNGQTTLTTTTNNSNSNNILSDDSGGEYSRTTTGTTTEDELISLLDQIARYSTQIRDSQPSTTTQSPQSQRPTTIQPIQHVMPSPRIPVATGPFHDQSVMTMSNPHIHQLLESTPKMPATYHGPSTSSGSAPTKNQRSQRSSSQPPPVLSVPAPHLHHQHAIAHHQLHHHHHHHHSTPTSSIPVRPVLQQFHPFTRISRLNNHNNRTNAYSHAFSVPTGHGHIHHRPAPTSVPHQLPHPPSSSSVVSPNSPSQQQPSSSSSLSALLFDPNPMAALSTLNDRLGDLTRSD